VNEDGIDPLPTGSKGEPRAAAVTDAQRRELRFRLAHHRAYPDEPTMPLAEIRKSLGVE